MVNMVRQPAYPRLSPLVCAWMQLWPARCTLHTAPVHIMQPAPAAAAGWADPARPAAAAGLAMTGGNVLCKPIT